MSYPLAILERLSKALLFPGFWRRGPVARNRCKRHLLPASPRPGHTLLLRTTPAFYLGVGGRLVCTERRPGFVLQNCQQNPVFERLYHPKPPSFHAKSLTPSGGFCPGLMAPALAAWARPGPTLGIPRVLLFQGGKKMLFKPHLPSVGGGVKPVEHGLNEGVVGRCWRGLSSSGKERLWRSPRGQGPGEGEEVRASDLDRRNLGTKPEGGGF